MVTSQGKCSELILPVPDRLPHATGDDVVDDLIGFGYLLVNSRRLTESAELFGVLLQYK
jgi:hypothetical protein